MLYTTRTRKGVGDDIKSDFPKASGKIGIPPIMNRKLLFPSYH